MFTVESFCAYLGLKVLGERTHRDQIGYALARIPQKNAYAQSELFFPNDRSEFCFDQKTGYHTLLSSLGEELRKNEEKQKQFLILFRHHLLGILALQLFFYCDKTYFSEKLHSYSVCLFEGNKLLHHQIVLAVREHDACCLTLLDYHIHREGVSYRELILVREALRVVDGETEKIRDRICYESYVYADPSWNFFAKEVATEEQYGSWGR